MKTTPLTETHQQLGAKMAEFAGYNMPISYTGIKDEHQAVRNQVGMFDVSHMGEFIIRGAQAPQLMQKLVASNVEKMKPGKAQYTCMTNEQGGIIDDFIHYKLDEETFMAIPNAANIQRDWEWMNQHNDFDDVEIINISDDTTLLAIQGPNAQKTLQPLTESDLSELKMFTFTRGQVAGVDNVIISATGYTGEPGFEIYFDNSEAQKVWNKVLEAGKDHGLKPAGLGARDTLRLEVGLCLHGNDIDESTTTLEARLGWLTKLDTDFIGRDALAKQKEEGITRKLMGFELQERGIPRKGYKIKDEEGSSIGEVTSGTQSPSLNKGIGMGYIQKDYIEPGTEIQIQIRKKSVPANVVKPPFYKKK
jgi:aminomethyltransferase